MTHPLTSFFHCLQVNADFILVLNTRHLEYVLFVTLDNMQKYYSCSFFINSCKPQQFSIQRRQDDAKKEAETVQALLKRIFYSLGFTINERGNDIRLLSNFLYDIYVIYIHDNINQYFFTKKINKLLLQTYRRTGILQRKEQLWQ